MNALQRIFMPKEKQALNYLVSLAAAEQNLSAMDIKTLDEYVDFLDFDHFRIIDRYKAIPNDLFSQFQMIYTLERELLQNGQLSEVSIEIMARLFAYFQIKKDRLRELIQYLKLNISSNKDAREAFDKLAYLMKPARA